MGLTFIETQVFTRRMGDLGLESELKALQETLLSNPAASPLDPGTGGLRKVRLSDPGRSKGKRGGARVHYLYLKESELVYLIYVYAKDEQDKLSPDQKRVLRRVVESIKKEHARWRPYG